METQEKVLKEVLASLTALKQNLPPNETFLNIKFSNIYDREIEKLITLGVCTKKDQIDYEELEHKELYGGKTICVDKYILSYKIDRILNLFSISRPEITIGFDKTRA